MRFVLYHINHFHAWLVSHPAPQASDIKHFPQEEPIERYISLRLFFPGMKHVHSPRLTLFSRLPLQRVWNINIRCGPHPSGELRTAVTRLIPSPALSVSSPLASSWNTSSHCSPTLIHGWTRPSPHPSSKEGTSKKDRCMLEKRKPRKPDNQTAVETNRLGLSPPRPLTSSRFSKHWNPWAARFPAPHPLGDEAGKWKGRGETRGWVIPNEAHGSWPQPRAGAPGEDGDGGGSWGPPGRDPPPRRPKPPGTTWPVTPGPFPAALPRPAPRRAPPAPALQRPGADPTPASLAHKPHTKAPRPPPPSRPHSPAEQSMRRPAPAARRAHPNAGPGRQGRRRGSPSLRLIST